MSAPRRVLPDGRRRGWCPSLARPMPTGDGLLARVHPPLGRLTPDQLRAVAEGARRHGNGHVDVTARANLQIRGVTETSAASLAAWLAQAGLGDRRNDGGPQRLTLTSPLAGLAPAEAFDVLALAAAIEAAALRIAGFPPKTLVAIEGPGIDGEGADVVLRPEAGAVAIRLAGCQDEIVVPEAATAATVIAVLTAFAATGRRRMRDLSAEERNRVLDRVEEGAGAHNPPPSAGEGACGAGGRGERRIRRGRCPSPPHFVGPLPRRGGREEALAAGAAAKLDVGLMVLEPHAVLAVEAPFGRCTAEGLEALAEIAEALGCAAIRLSPTRGFVLACADHVNATFALEPLAAAGFVTTPDDPRRAVAACPGAPACASGSTPVPDHAERLARAFAPFAARGLTAHVSGCTKGCAHPAPAALTLVAEAGRYRVLRDGAPGEASGPLKTFESVLERVSTADPTRPLAQAFRP